MTDMLSEHIGKAKALQEADRKATAELVIELNAKPGVNLKSAIREACVDLAIDMGHDSIANQVLFLKSRGWTVEDIREELKT